MRRGFTLLELSISLLLAGLMAAFIIKISAGANRADCYVTTKAQMEQLKNAVERFSIKNDRFPRPARRNVGVQDLAYGREALATDIDRLDNGDGTFALFGALPFQALGIPVENASDCWGNKYSYVVTEALTSNSTSNGFLDPLTKGGFSLRGDAGTTFLNEVGYAIISHGEDGFGAVKNNYSSGVIDTVASRGWCTFDGAYPLNTQNCDVQNNILVNAQFNDGQNGGNRFYDDLIVYRGKPWRVGIVAESNAWCWGRNSIGSAGANDTMMHPTPVRVSGGVKFTSITNGGKHSCARTAADGTAYCWGDGYWGQTGAAGVYGVAAPNRVPLLVDTPQKFISLSANNLNTCGVSTGNVVFCWGKNDYGQIGNGLYSSTGTPQSVPGTFEEVSTGATHACARNAAGNAWCWGSNYNGQIGNGTYNASPVVVGDPTNPSTPTFVSGGPFSAIAAGTDQTCAIASGSGAIYCWGKRAWMYYNGASSAEPNCIFNGGHMQCHTPKAVDVSSLPIGDRSFKKITVGGQICALTTADGTAYCWRGNMNTPIAVDTPTALNVSGIAVMADRKFIDIKAGTAHVCALAASGREYCWGSNTDAAMGTGGGDLAAPSTPVLGSGAAPTIFTDIAAGGEVSCAITAP